MLRQTAESPDRRRVLHPGDEYTPVELGTFRDLVFEHDLTKEISFLVEWNLPRLLVITDHKTKREFLGESLSFEACVAFDEKDNAPRVAFFEYRLADPQEGPLRVSMTAAGAQNSLRQQFELSTEPYELVRNPGRVWKLPPPVRFYGFPDEVNIHFQDASFTSDLALALEQQLRRIQYLGPLRTDPKRSYVWSGEVPDHWDGREIVR